MCRTFSSKVVIFMKMNHKNSYRLNLNITLEVTDHKLGKSVKYMLGSDKARGAWLAQSVEPGAPDLGALSWSPMLGAEIT